MGGDTHRARNLHLVVHATPLRVVGGFGLLPRLLALQIDDLRLVVKLDAVRAHRLRLVGDRGRDLAKLLTRVPDLQDDVEDAAIDPPRDAAEHIQADMRP